MTLTAELRLGRKATGLQTQHHGSASLDALSRQITAVMRQLRALIVKHLRENDPTLLEVWNAAARTYSQPVGAAAGSEETGSGSGGGQPVAS